MRNGWEGGYLLCDRKICRPKIKTGWYGTIQRALWARQNSKSSTSLHRQGILVGGKNQQFLQNAYANVIRYANIQILGTRRHIGSPQYGLLAKSFNLCDYFAYLIT